ncbi:MAG: DUF4105 domain-containing protein [bacterium]
MKVSEQNDKALWRRVMARFFLILVLAPFVVWSLLVFVFGSWPGVIGMALAGLVAAGSVASLFLFSTRRALLAVGGLFAFSLVCFFLMRPSNNRPWLPDVERAPYADISGDKVVLHNVRNCAYLNETNFMVQYETRTYDLSRLKSVDIMFSDWGLKYIAHTMLSFGFEGGDYLCVSIETRKEIGENYSALKGFFRQYELMYIAADERDVVGLRTNFREGEDVYLYRVRVVNRSQIRAAFLDYMNRMNELHEKAEWYNALTDNCMTSGFRILKKHAANGRADLHWSVILNGFAADHAYTTGALDTSLPFEELKRRSRINDRARAAGSSPDFSAQIREGMPGMEWNPGKGQ